MKYLKLLVALAVMLVSIPTKAYKEYTMLRVTIWSVLARRMRSVRLMSLLGAHMVSHHPLRM